MGQTSEREATVKVGDVIEGRYRILKTLGAGGMGTVFLAEHTLIKRRVAIKILHADLATDADVIERFMNEARAAGTLGHPNIVESTDMGFTHNNVPYIVFEYLEGSLLTDEIYRVKGMPLRRALRVAEQIASALHAAHNANIVHRDLKTDNVFLTDKDDALDHVKVLDFGISRFLETDDDHARRGMVMGTPESMAPEQITSPDQVDRRADVYALGVMLYEMLSARRPFSGDNQEALLERIVYEAPPALNVRGVPAALEELIVVQMLAKDPGARPQTMSDVLAALEPFGEPEDRAIPRRRTQPINVSRTVSSDTGLIPVSRDTPWPLAGQAVSQVSLPAHTSRGKSRVLYGLAAGGVMLGALGLMMSMRSGGDATTASAPATNNQAAAAMPMNKKVAVTFASDVDGARVVFRRQNAAAPSTLEISPSDVVELVEVSAPGYRTERYWLTVDRPTKLTAHLERGDGTAEATEEETLVALGEHTAAPQQVAEIEVPSAPLAATPTATAVHPLAVANVPAPMATVDSPKPAATTLTMPRKNRPRGGGGAARCGGRAREDRGRRGRDRADAGRARARGRSAEARRACGRPSSAGAGACGRGGPDARADADGDRSGADTRAGACGRGGRSDARATGSTRGRARRH